jgi:hypothetical protein
VHIEDGLWTSKIILRFQYIRLGMRRLDTKFGEENEIITKVKNSNNSNHINKQPCKKNKIE